MDENAIEEAKAIAPFVDALLLDSGNPNLAVKELAERVVPTIGI